MILMMGDLSKLGVCVSIAGGVGKNKHLILRCYQLDEFA